MRRFPANFLFGGATAAHQVEGHCSNNHWWAFEQQPGNINDGSISGNACDHYRRFDDDYRLARTLGHNAQRISVEWSRVEPREGVFDEAELDHYKAVCDAIRRHGMQPTVTLHHFTNPLWAQRAGGWESPQMVDWLARYAEKVGRALGDRATMWWTINEPMVAPIVCYLLGYHPPCINDMARALVAAKHALRAHGAMYRALKAVVPSSAPVGIVHNMPFFEPIDPENDEHRAEAAQHDHFMNQWFLDGIITGRIGAPVGEGEEEPGLRDSSDVIGLNYYSRVLTGAGMGLAGGRRQGEVPLFDDEMGWEVHPRGLTEQLVRLAALGKPLYVTENGHATLDEESRSRYVRVHLGHVLDAIDRGADVRGYFYWSLMDNFEWREGYLRHFGLIGVDRATLARTVRPAAAVLRDIIARGGLDA